MFRILTLLLLVIALIVPRAAWAAHEAGHDGPLGPAVEHVHHGDHSHDLTMQDHVDDPSSFETPVGDAGLVHDHLPADVLSAIADLDAGKHVTLLPAFVSSHALDKRPDGDPATPSGFLFRPPLKF